jgi:penicillin-binding protein 1A
MSAPTRTSPVRNTRRQRKRRRAKPSRARWIWLAVFLLVLLLIIVAAGLAGTIFALSRNLPNLESAERMRLAQNSVIYDRNGRQIAVLHGAMNRQVVASSRIPQVMKDATVAIEDKRFYEHHGVDFLGIARAAIADVRAGEVVQGGSTLTAQFVKNAYVGGEQTVTRKLREAVLAWQLEDKWSKDKILSEYLNTVYYGSGAYGVQTASMVYLHKPVWRVTLPEAALLAGLPRFPSDYDPTVDPMQARQRRNLVLDEMAAQGYITPARAARAKKASLGVFDDPPKTERDPAAYFVDYVTRQLIDKYGARQVYEGGLRIYTSIDMHMQESAIASINSTLNLPDDPAAAIVAVDPQTGYIRAMVGGSNWKKQKFNLAWQSRRQPGSAAKTFALVTAVEEGADPTQTFYVSRPLHIPMPGAPGGVWNVATYDHTYNGRMSLLQATLASDNTVFAQLCLDIGPKKVVKTAHKMGITSPLDPVPSIVLGTEVVNPLEMADAYATLASGGIHHDPVAVEKVVFPSGRVDRTKTKGERVISPGTAYVISKILEENCVAGTAAGMSAYYPGIAAGKTGTTDNYVDAWFCGYNPRLAAAVWMGYPKNFARPMTSVHGQTVAGATFCVPMWGKFMKGALGGVAVPEFAKPKVMPVWKPWKGKYSKAGGPSPHPSKTKPANGQGGGGGPTPTPTVTFTATPKPSPTKTTPKPSPTATTPKPVANGASALAPAGLWALLRRELGVYQAP